MGTQCLLGPSVIEICLDARNPVFCVYEQQGLISVAGKTDFSLVFVGNPEDRFCRHEAKIWTAFSVTPSKHIMKHTKLQDSSQENVNVIYYMFSFGKISQLLTLSEQELPAYSFRENSFDPHQAKKMLVCFTL